MSRRKLAKENNEDEELIPEIPARWSVKRIAIALTFLFIVAASIYYYFSLKNFQEQPNKVLGVSSRENKPEITLPSKESVDTIIKDAKESLSKIDANNVVSSQPEIQKIIQDLQNLTKKDADAKNMICDLVCKE